MTKSQTFQVHILLLPCPLYSPGKISTAQTSLFLLCQMGTVIPACHPQRAERGVDENLGWTWGIFSKLERDLCESEGRRSGNVSPQHLEGISGDEWTRHGAAGLKASPQLPLPSLSVCWKSSDHPRGRWTEPIPPVHGPCPK